jgi:hypothetical protein
MNAKLATVVPKGTCFFSSLARGTDREKSAMSLLQPFMPNLSSAIELVFKEKGWFRTAARMCSFHGCYDSEAVKARLRWTPDLHDKFVAAVAKLGGPDRKCQGLPQMIWFRIQDWLGFL